MWRENTFSMRSEQGGEERSELLIDVQQMSKIYNEGRENEVRALDNISLSVQWGEFLCILGQSGSGKSTRFSGFSSFADSPMNSTPQSTMVCCGRSTASFASAKLSPT